MTASDPAVSPEPDTDRTAFDPILSIARRQFLSVPPETTAREALRLFADQPDDTAPDHACVTLSDGQYIGLVSLRTCLRAGPETELRALLLQGVETIEPDTSAEAGAAVLAGSVVDCLPVVDGRGYVLGLVTSFAAERYLVAEMERDTNRAVGILDEDVSDDYLERPILTDFKRRVPWILSLAVAGLGAGYVVHVYEDALDALVILALYMPMVADTGGNVGTQSASLVTRAISFGEVHARDVFRVLWREARVALLMAATLCAFAFLKVLLISNAGDVPEGLSLQGIGFAIALALAAQVISATLIGAILPIAAVAARQDPAVVSGPALTTIVDLTGLILYFGLTTHLLGIG